MTGAPEESTDNGSGEVGDRTCDPWLTRRVVTHYATAASKKPFCGFSMGSNQYWARRVYDLCVSFMTGTPEGSTESGFYGEAGYQTCDPWFTRHRFIPCTTEASHHGGFIGTLMVILMQKVTGFQLTLYNVTLI